MFFANLTPIHWSVLELQYFEFFDSLTLACYANKTLVIVCQNWTLHLCESDIWGISSEPANKIFDWKDFVYGRLLHVPLATSTWQSLIIHITFIVISQCYFITIFSWIFFNCVRINKRNQCSLITVATNNSVNRDKYKPSRWISLLARSDWSVIYIRFLAFINSRADVGRFCPRFFELIQMKTNYSWKWYSVVGFILKQLLPSVSVPSAKSPHHRFAISLFTSTPGNSC